MGASAKSISIALCTCNGAQFLEEQLQSLAAQTLLPCELQVGDDQSTDDTLAILEQFAASAPFPVQIHRNEKKLGYGENFIQTALRCNADWIAFCDQDDIWLSQKLARCWQAIEHSAEDLQLVVHNLLRFDEKNTSSLAYDWPELSVCPRFSYWPGSFDLGFSQVFRRSLIYNFPTQDRKLPWVGVTDAHDVWVSFLASSTGTTARIGEPLVLYRQHSTNASLAIPAPEQPLWGKEAQNSFEAVAQTISSMAEILARLQLGEAEDHYRKVAQRFATRARIYLGKNPARSFMCLLMSGAYASGDYSKFGRRAMVEDLRAIISRWPSKSSRA